MSDAPSTRRRSPPPPPSLPSLRLPPRSARLRPVPQAPPPDPLAHHACERPVLLHLALAPRPAPRVRPASTTAHPPRASSAPRHGRICTLPGHEDEAHTRAQRADVEGQDDGAALGDDPPRRVHIPSAPAGGLCDGESLLHGASASRGTAHGLVGRLSTAAGTSSSSDGRVASFKPKRQASPWLESGRRASEEQRRARARGRTVTDPYLSLSPSPPPSSRPAGSPPRRSRPPQEGASLLSLPRLSCSCSVLCERDRRFEQY